MSELWSGAGCEASADYVFDHVSASGVRMFRKVGPRRYIGDAPDASGRLVPVFKRAASESTPALQMEASTMTDVMKARDTVNDVIERQARREFPDEPTVPQSVAKFLDTPAGAKMYRLYNALGAVAKSNGVHPGYVMVEVIAERLMAEGKTPAKAYEAAFGHVAKR